jgi:hypothetical protein
MKINSAVTNPDAMTTSGDEEDQKRKLICTEKRRLTQVQLQERWLGEERKPNPNLGSVYHVMNITYIHLRAIDSNIQEGENMQRTIWRNTIIGRLVHI